MPALDSRKAHQVLRELENSQDYIPAMYIAAIYAALSDRDRSIQWIQNAYVERSDYLIYLKTEPSIDNLRSSPKFQGLQRLITLNAKNSR